MTVPGLGQVAVGSFLCWDLCVARYNACFVPYLEYQISVQLVEETLSCSPPYWGDFGYTNTDIFPKERNYSRVLEIVNGSKTYSVNVTLTCDDSNINIFAGIGELYCPSGNIYIGIYSNKHNSTIFINIIVN